MTLYQLKMYLCDESELGGVTQMTPAEAVSAGILDPSKVKGSDVAAPVVPVTATSSPVAPVSTGRRARQVAKRLFGVWG